jgi:AcrR family transcriptional regulator
MTAAERGKRETRERLIDAALEVFLQHGFARATTREIARTAGVAEGTIYRHFVDKHSLFRAVFAFAVGNLIEELGRLPDLAGRATVRENLRYLLGLLSEIQQRSAPLMASIEADPELARSFAVHLEGDADAQSDIAAPLSMTAVYIHAEQDLGRIRSDVDPVEAAAVVVAGSYARGVQRVLGEQAKGAAMPAGFPPATSSGLDILAQGLAPVRDNGTNDGSHACEDRNSS